MIKLRHLAALVLLLSAASGCAKVGPDFELPPAPVPAAWIEADATRARQDMAMNEEWWRVFGSPVLDRLIQEAYDSNLSVRIAGLRVLEARALLGQAVGNLYPQSQGVNADLYNYKGSERGASAPQPGSNTDAQFSYWQGSVSLGATWELDFWGRYRRSVESAEASLRSTVADYDSALVSMASDVATAYVTARTYQLRLAIAKENAELQREALDIAQTRLDLGATSQRDVQQAQTQLKATEATIPLLVAGLKQSLYSLSLLLGRTPSDLSEHMGLIEPVPVVPGDVAVSIPADMIRRRPDIRSAEAAAAAQCARVGVVEAQLYPSFSLSGEVGFLASTVGAFRLDQLLSRKSTFSALGVSGGWNLFNYGQIMNQVRAEDAYLEELLQNYMLTVLTALKEAEDSMSRFKRAQDRAELLVAATESARESAQLAAVQYREGQTDFTTVITALQSQLTQQDSLASTQGDIALNLISLFRALGGGWQMREGHDFVPPEIKARMAKRTDWGSLLEEAPTDIAQPEQRAGRLTPDW